MARKPRPGPQVNHETADRHAGDHRTAGEDSTIATVVHACSATDLRTAM